MEVEELINKLNQIVTANHADSDKNCQELIDILSTSVTKEEHTETALDVILSLLFRPRNSLLSFVEEAAKLHSLKNPLKHSLKLIHSVFCKYSRKVLNYVVSTKDVCYECVRDHKIADVINQAYDIIIEILNPKYQLSPGEVNGLVTFLHNRVFVARKSLVASVAGKAYELFGAIAENYPANCNDKIPSVVRHILHELKVQMKTTSNVQFTIITGCMNALTGILTNFTHDFEEDPEKSREIYSYVKDASVYNDSTNHRRVFQRAALKLLSKHIGQFWQWVMQDHSFWLKELPRWASRANRDDKWAGIDTLKAFHTHAARHLKDSTQLSNQGSAESKLMKTLLGIYKKTFSNPNAESYELELSVEGFGTLAPIHGRIVNDSNAVPFMFTVILQRAQTDFREGRSSDSDDNHSCNLAKYVETLSSICKELPSVSNDQLTALQQLVRLLVDSYPHYNQHVQWRVLAALSKTVLHMSLCGSQVFDTFLNSVVYQGIVLTCGQVLVEDAELQREMTGQEVVTYKNYLPIWTELLKIGYASPRTSVPEVNLDMRRHVVDKLYGSIIQAFFAIVDKLDVGYRKQDAEELEMKSDPESSLRGNNPQDQKILCNLANLYKDLLEHMDNEQVTPWLPQMITNIVPRSVGLPLVSAFYKLLASILAVSNKTHYFQDESQERQSLGRYVVRYLEEVMIHCRQYKNDLQASCLLAIIAAPVELIQPLLAGIPSVLQMIFQLGQSYLPLALSGLDALERWLTILTQEQLKPILQQTLPCFDTYLRSRGIILEDMRDDDMQLSRRLEAQRKRITESTLLSKVQQRMLKLLSQLDSVTCLSLLRQPATPIAWTSGPTLTTVKLPFPDQRTVICLDVLLPRVVELALKSSDRQTKTTACEVLHALVLIVIRTGIEPLMESNIKSVLNQLMPALLQLASGSDLVAKQLFHLQVLQLMHWYSSRQMQGRAQTEAVLIAIWDGVTNEKDPALQDFAAFCLQEFIEWSIKQTPDDQLEENPCNIKAVVRQINTYCVHPSLSKRVGAALAFNHLAKILGDHASIVNKFWIELLYNFVRNLSLSSKIHNHPASIAIDHLLKVFQRNQDLFNQVNEERRRPSALQTGSLRDLLRWLLLQCGSKSKLCADKCRNLVVHITRLVPELVNITDLAEGEDMVRVCEGGGVVDGVLPIQPTVADGEHLRASLDCYVWCISKGLTSPSILLVTPSKLLACVEYFINIVGLNSSERSGSSEERAHTDTKCKIIIALCDLIGLLDDRVINLPTTLWNTRFWNLIALCVMSPGEVGFDWQDHGASEKLQSRLRVLLCTLREHSRLVDLSELYDQLSRLVLCHCVNEIRTLALMCQDIKNDNLHRHYQFITGLQTLHRTDLLRHLTHGSTWIGNTIVEGVASSFFGPDGVALYPETSVLQLAKQLLNFAFVLEARINLLVSCLLDSTQAPDSRSPLKLTRGQHFLALCQDVILAHLQQCPQAAVQSLLHQPCVASLNLVLKLLQACKHSSMRRASYGEELVQSVAASWTRLSTCITTHNISNTLLVDLIKAMVATLPPSSAVGFFARSARYDALRLWLIQEITNRSLLLEYKESLLDLLPSLHSNREPNVELETVLRFLHEHHFPASCSELRPGSVERNTFTAVYKALLRVLVTTGSVSVLRFVSSAAADEHHACSEFIATALGELMTKHPQEKQVAALKEIYTKFSSESCDEGEAIRLMENFLIPMICKASKPAVTIFYSENIQKTIDIFEEKLRLADNDRKSKQQLVRKIGAVQMTECLFSHLEKKDLEDANNTVVMRATVPNSVKLTKYFASVLLNLRKADCSVASLQDLFRKMQCSNFKALMSFCCNSGLGADFFAKFLFDEKPPHMIWRKLIPTLPKYSFPIEFDDFPKIKKQLVQIRSVATVRNVGTAVEYLPTQSLFNSSLQEDITRYDFSMYNVLDSDTLTPPQERSLIAGVELEADCLNEHECMATLCATVKHLCETFPVVKPGEPSKVPQWMEYLQASLTSRDQPENCRAFIVKLILNCQSYFKPLARYWILPILECVNDKCFGDNMNFLIHDIVRMLYDWHTEAIPDSTTHERLLASEFLRWLVLNTTNHIKSIFNYNIEVVRIVLTMWKSCTSVPYQELLNLITPSSNASVLTGIRLAETFLAHNILPFNETGKLSYYKNLIANFGNTHKDVYRQNSYVVGRILKVASENGQGLAETEQQFLEQVVDCINPRDGHLRTANGLSTTDHLIVCLYEIQKNYPPITKSFTIQCISNLNKVGNFRKMLVEILTAALDSDFRHEAFSLLQSDLRTLLNDHNNPDVQVATLKFVDKLMPSLSPEQMAALLPAVLSLQEHNSSSCRTVVYDIVEWIYDKYRDLNDDNAKGLVKDSQTILIAGLADTNKELQDKLYRFWTMNGRLATNAVGRLVDILKIVYAPSCEDMFLSTLVSLMLQLCEQANEFNENIFPNPLSECSFQDYKVCGSFRMQHAAFVPMFADTLASQMSSAPDTFSDLSVRLRASQSQSSLLISVSQAQDEPSSLYSLGSLSSASPASLSRSYKQGLNFGSDLLQPVVPDEDKSKSQDKGLKPIRFLKNKEKVSRRMASRNIAKSERQQKQLSERTQRKEGTVILTRKYRKGDLPDIEIPYSGFINSLRALAKQDQLIARQLAVCIYKGLVKNEETSVHSVATAIDHILQKSTSHEPSLTATLLELSLVKPSLCVTPASLITEVSKKSHQLSLGALLVEEKILLDNQGQAAPPTKRARGRPRSDQDNWMCLAEIYHSMEEKDVVQGVFEDKIAEQCADLVRDALQAEEQSRWKKAMTLYQGALEACKNTLAENFLFEACFKCCAHLSNWRHINRDLKSNQLENNLDDIWFDDWNKDHLLPWLFLSEVHCSQELNELSVSTDFNNALTRWMSDSSQAEHIKSKLGEYLSVVLMIKDEAERSKLACEREMKQFLTRWQQLDPLCSNLRAYHLLQLHPLMDIHSFVSLPAVSEEHFYSRLDRLLKLWDKTIPDTSTDLVTWETRAVYRNIFTSKLESKVQQRELVKKKLRMFKLETHLKTAEAAIEQDNFYLAKKYLLTKCSPQIHLLDNENRFKLDVTMFTLMRARLERDPSIRKVNLALDSWDGVRELQIPDENRDPMQALDVATKLTLFRHSANVYQTLLSTIQELPTVTEDLSEADKERLHRLLGTQDTTMSVPTLRGKIIDSYLEAASVGPVSSLADSFLKLAHFCHQIDGEAYTAQLIEALLRAMKYGSADARRLFPCLLQLPLRDYADLFLAESGSVPEWMFLAWSNQLLASLDTEIGSVLAPLLEQLAKAYPVALQFPFQLSCEMYRNTFPHTQQTVQKLKPLLKLDETTEALMTALGYICHPEVSFLYHVERMRDCIFETDKFALAFALLKTESYPPEPHDKYKGRVFENTKKYAQKMDTYIEMLENKTLSKEELKNKLNQLGKEIRDELQMEDYKKRRMKRCKLQNFSPWLVDGYDGQVEVPGQYTGDMKPLPHTHLTIAGFGTDVMSFQSLRAPIQVTVLGNDAKEHKLIIKFGEDLRQDQRIQQLFGLMNHMLGNNVVTSRRGLYLDTYTVSPLSTRLGIIECIEDTVVLKSFITLNNNAELVTKLQSAFIIYSRSSSRNVDALYGTISKEDALLSYKQAINSLPQHMLKEALWRLAVSPEAYVHLRSEMLTSHACLCVCHWLLGIGDRHLENTLVSRQSGRFIGIDFGHAFGTATQNLSIPELIPCRLTPQILNLAAPLHHAGLIKETMVNTLHVLRNSQQVLLAAMAVFTQEPSLDWLKVAKQTDNAAAGESRELSWYPAEKIAIARRKLEGVHPRLITEEELTSSNREASLCERMLRVLRDTALDMPSQNLTARQQVECLIDQATNENILSKTYYGWHPFV